MPPFSIIRIFWRLGKNRRRVIPVVCRPIPPLAFGNPRRVIMLPLRTPLPQISQTRAIMNSLSMPVNKCFVFHPSIRCEFHTFPERRDTALLWASSPRYSSTKVAGFWDCAGWNFCYGLAVFNGAHRLSVRTPGFHPGKRSSTLRGRARLPLFSRRKRHHEHGSGTGDQLD